MKHFASFSHALHIYSEKEIYDSFQIENNMIAVTGCLLIMNQKDVCLAHNQKKNWKLTLRSHSFKVEINAVSWDMQFFLSVTAAIGRNKCCHSLRPIAASVDKKKSNSNMTKNPISYIYIYISMYTSVTSFQNLIGSGASSQTLPPPCTSLLFRF